MADGSEQLFREEALRHSHKRIAGEVMLATPLSFRILAAVAVGAVVVALLVCFFVSYARRELVSGWIVPEGGLVRVSARQAGVVIAVTVREGDRVPAGAVLAQLRVSNDLVGGDAAEALQGGLDAERAALAMREEVEGRKATAEVAQLKARLPTLRRELDELTARAAIQGQRSELAGAAVVRAEQLAAQGYVPAASLDALRSSAFAARERLSESRSQAIVLKRQISTAEQDAASREEELKILLASGAEQRAKLSQRQTTADLQRLLAPRAPVAARVLALPVSQGQGVAAGDTIAVLQPGQGDLQAELYAPSRAVGFLRPGQPVILRYDAFPYRTYGSGRGHIDSISRTAISAGEAKAPGLRASDPVFRVRVRLNRDWVEAYGKRLPLQPGMGLSAEVEVERRTLVGWLLDPVYAVTRK